VVKSLSKLPNACPLAVKDALDYYGEKIIVRHFNFGNERSYNYPKLSPEYVKRKRKAVGNKPQLVYSGKLKNKVTSSARGEIISPRQVNLWIRFPNYGYYNLQRGADFIRPNKRDWRDIIRYARKSFAKIRQGKYRKRR
jgi:hypothetical protein